MKIETLQTFAPELLPNDIVEIPQEIQPIKSIIKIENDPIQAISEQTPEEPQRPGGFKMPRMPLVSSEAMKLAVERQKRGLVMEDAAVNTGGDHDVANEISKYVGTLKKISLIAEEFNQKTGKGDQ